MDDDDPYRYRSRKNTKKWCRGKVGTPHELHLVRRRFEFGPHVGRDDPGPCPVNEPNQWMPCNHQEVCRRCGRITRHLIYREECPDYVGSIPTGVHTKEEQP